MDHRNERSSRSEGSRTAALRALVIGIVLLAISASGARAAAGAGSLRGVVVGEDGKPAAGITIMLRNDITGFKATTLSQADGAYEFDNLPFNPYELVVEVKGFQRIDQGVQIRLEIPAEMNVRLSKATELVETVEVKAKASAGQLETDTSVSHIDIDKSFISKVPAATPSRAMEQIVTSTPGFAKDENGRYHFQGTHSAGEYVIDGQTMSDQMGITFSNSIDPGIAQSLEVIYGNIPAEYGEKDFAVINVTTKSAMGTQGWGGDLFGGGGSYSTNEEGGSVQYGTDRFGVFISGAATQSDRFLDPVNFENLNNQGTSSRGFMRLDWATPDHSDTIRLTTLFGRSSRDVTNTFTQDTTGQDQTVDTTDQNVNFGWQHLFSGKTLFDLTATARNSSYTLNPSAGDTPVTASSERSLDNYGLTPTLTWISGPHEVKMGVVFKRFPINERFSFGITDPNLNDPASPDFNPSLAPYDLTRGGQQFQFRQDQTGTYYAAFAQDNMRLGHFTANLGLRYDHNNLPITDAQIEPRVGVAYYFPGPGTVLRASYNRLLVTPAYENILLSSSPEAATLVPPSVAASRELGGGELDIKSERQNAYDLGVQQALGKRLRLDVDYWDRQAHFSSDQDQFLNTGIVFPISFASGHYNGWNLRLDYAETKGLAGYLSLGHTHAIYDPPPAGGLFLDQESVGSITGPPFLIDHDQQIQLQSAVIYTHHRSGIWGGMNVRYDSGLVTDADPASLAADPDNAFAAPFVTVHSATPLDPNRIEARTVWDFSVGVDLSKYGTPLSITADLLNAFDKDGVYNILSVFGGTHVIPPRTFALRVRYTFGKKGQPASQMGSFTSSEAPRSRAES